MNRLQKKCALVTVGIHLLLVTILIVGPGFFAPKPKADDLQILDVIPANLIDAAFNSGVHDATPPPPTPIVTPPAPTPPAPTPIVTPPPASVEPPEPVRPEVREPTPEPKPADKPKIQINTQLVTRNAPKNTTSANQQNDLQRQQQQRARAFQNAVRSLKNNFTSATKIDVPGAGSVSYASYDAVVKSVYERTMNTFLPNEIANDNEITKVRVTIASDGTVTSSRIVSPSGDPVWDAAVQHTLDRVTYIAPFPEGATEKERTYPISFNPQVERTLE